MATSKTKAKSKSKSKTAPPRAAPRAKAWTPPVSVVLYGIEAGRYGPGSVPLADVVVADLDAFVNEHAQVLALAREAQAKRDAARTPAAPPGAGPYS